MHIVGGFYRELCCIPPWDSTMGSGGRAATAISILSPGSIFHTYSEVSESEAIERLRTLGLELRLTTRPHAVVFAYFHPLSTPHIKPSPHEIERQASILVKGEAVLRFGFIEGDAVVKGERVVYDPQTWRNPENFRENGSTANELAIVLNSLELRSLTGIEDMDSAALKLMQQQGAVVVVVKQGIRGAEVFELGGKRTRVPAYRSARVFKIGTGDVFSAVFAHYWTEAGTSAVEAADIASHSVAIYCNTGGLPVQRFDQALLRPLNFIAPGRVFLLGAGGTIGQRYTLEEAQFVLRELGTEVRYPGVESPPYGSGSAVLVLADGLTAEVIAGVESAMAASMPVVVLQEAGVEMPKAWLTGNNIAVTDDFVSAMYLAAWAAAERPV